MDGPFSRWAIRTVKCGLAQALYVLGVFNWLLVSLWFLWGFCLYVLQVSPGIHKIQNVSPNYLTTRHGIKAGRTLVVLNKSVLPVPITSINKRVLLHLLKSLHNLTLLTAQGLALEPCTVSFPGCDLDHPWDSLSSKRSSSVVLSPLWGRLYHYENFKS